MKRLVISNAPLTFLFGIQILWATLSYSFQFWQDDTTDYKVTYNYELVPDFERLKCLPFNLFESLLKFYWNS